MVSRVKIEPIRSLDAASISGSYAVVGSATSNRCRLICITNNTEGDVYFSIDGSTDHLFVANGSYKTFDLQANMNAQKDDSYVLEVGTQFYVKQITSPVSGDVYIEVLY